MSSRRGVKTLAASAIALAFGAMSVGSAWAFDVVDWNWYNDKYQTEHVDVDIDIDVDSTGLVQLEKLQIFFGSVSTYATTVGVVNIPPDPGGYWRETYACYCYGSVWVPYGLDATTQLPEVKTASAAFGNLQVIKSDVPVFLHDGQFVANGGYGEANPIASLAFGFLVGFAGFGEGNIHTDLAKAFTIGAAFGVLTPADIHTSAYTALIVNASVDNSATAAANLIQVQLESDAAGQAAQAAPVGGLTFPFPYPNPNPYPDPQDPISNHIVQADITQFAYANVSASAEVLGVVVDNYSNLGNLDGPLVNNTATAIGNGVIINVGPVPPPVP
jgi:hypothetical protein